MPRSASSKKSTARTSSSARSSSSKKKTTTTRSSSKTANKNATTVSSKNTQPQQQQQQQKQPSSHHLRLLSWFEVPQFLQYNRFVQTGYRPQLTSIEAWKSMFNGFHNETANIWTHFLPLFFFLYFIYEEIHRCYFTSTAGGSAVVVPHPPFRWLYVLSSIAAIFVCSVSTSYHTLMCACKNHDQYTNLICIDILGSVVVISTTSVAMLVFGNPCLSFFTKTWMITLFALSTVTTIYFIFSRSMSAARRFALFGGHVMLRLTLQFMILMPKYRATGHFKAMELHTHSFIFLVIGGVINVFRLPERFFTKVEANPLTGEIDRVSYRTKYVAVFLDYFGNSHNLWHVLSIWGCYLTVMGVVEDYSEFHDLDGKVQCGTWK